MCEDIKLAFNAKLVRGVYEEINVQVIADNILEAESALREHYPDMSFVISGPVRRNTSMRSLEARNGST